MQRLIYLSVIVSLLVLPIGLFADVFATKAQELTSERETRIDKLIAVHAFVRDEIRQIKTSFS